MITDSFNKSQGKISPEMIYGPGKKITDTCLVTFSYKLMNLIVDSLKPEVIATIKSTNSSIPIYLLKYKGKEIAIYNSYMGSALAGTCMIEASHFTGAEKFIMFGSAGRLESSIPSQMFIVPSKAYRDEGFSYHYAMKSDYIEFKNHAFIEAFLSSKKIPYITGPCWTTDAFYKETEEEIALRRKEGCLAVDMECAGCQAVSDFYHWDFYEFFFGDDLLDSKYWDKGDMGTDSSKKRHYDIFSLVLDMALEI